MTITRADKLKGVRYKDMSKEELKSLSKQISAILSEMKTCEATDREKSRELFDQVHNLGFVSLSEAIEMLHEINTLIEKSS